LVEIGSVVSEEKNLFKFHPEIKIKSSPLKLLCQSQPNFAEMILGWSPFKIVSVNTVLYPRWPPLLKIEISSNGQKRIYFKPESAQI
jgi:hypothetical protein